MRKFLAHLFLPHQSNKYRAKILHHKSLLFFIVVFFVGNFFISHIPQQYESVLGVSSSITPQELLVLTNSKREERGLPPLTLNSSLAQAAEAKASDMFAKNYWAHIAPDGTTPWFFIRSSGYEYIHAGENLARGFSTSSDVVNAWMESPGHRDNMLSPHYKDIGFAIATGTLTGDETVLVVEMFGSAQSTSQEVTAQSSLATQPTPTPATQSIPSEISVPTPTIIFPVNTPTPTPLVQPQSVQEATPTPFVQVAAAINQPLINSTSLQRNIAITTLLLLLLTLILDVIIVRRNRISRLLSHNIDHIIFLSVLLIIAVLVSRGGIL